MTFVWKMTIIAAAGCFALSLLTGIIAGVEFWPLLLRAFLLGLLGGGLALGLRFLVLRFLPELGSEDYPDSFETETGRNVDIVVSENPQVGKSADAAVAGRDEPSANATGDSLVSAPSDDDTDFAEELEELKSSPILTGRSDGEDSTYQPVKPPEVIDDVDVLPDLEVFQDSFSMAASEGGGDSESLPASSSRHSSSSSGGGGANDPDLIAQAIRTALARDKKG